MEIKTNVIGYARSHISNGDIEILDYIYINMINENIITEEKFESYFNNI